MEKIILLDSIVKEKRGFFTSFFLNCFCKQYYIDNNNKYKYELKDLSKISDNSLKTVLQVICEESLQEQMISTYSIEEEKEKLVLFSKVKRVEVDKKLLSLKESRIIPHCFCPAEYVVGKFFSKKYKDKNLIILLNIKGTTYISIIKSGILLWVSKAINMDENEILFYFPDMSGEGNPLREILREDIFIKKMMTEKDVNEHRTINKKLSEDEIVFWKWVDAITC